MTACRTAAGAYRTAAGVLSWFCRRAATSASWTGIFFGPDPAGRQGDGRKKTPVRFAHDDTSARISDLGYLATRVAGHLPSPPPPLSSLGVFVPTQRSRQTPPTANAAPGPFEPDLQRAVDLVMEMMAIPGPSGQEAEIADFIVTRLVAAGVPRSQIKFDTAHKRSPLGGQLGNMVLKLAGTSRAPRRMMTAHLDTVPICVGSVPSRRGNTVRSRAPGRGLGADNRAGCAVLLSALLEIHERDLPHPPLTVCWFVQEEVGLQGARAASRGLWGNPQLAFNWDGGAPTKLTIGATGGYRSEINIHGLASHAGNAPEKGVSAIAIAGLAIADLHQNGWHGDVRKGSHHGTSNVGIIQGGDATNVVTQHVYVKAEARSHDPKFRKKLLTEIENAFRRAAKAVRNVDGEKGRVSIVSRLDYESFLLPSDEPCVRVAQSAIRAVGGDPELAVANGGVDANWMTAHGLPTVSLGCGQKYQHMASETLNVSQFELACRAGLRLATGTEGPCD